MSTRVDSFSRGRQNLFSNVSHSLTRIAIPAMSWLAGTLGQWVRNYKTRRRLNRLPDHLLKDIGLKRADVVRETSKPFWR